MSIASAMAEGRFESEAECGVRRASARPLSAWTTVSCYLVGGGVAHMKVEAEDLDGVADLLRRERGVIGQLLAMNGDETVVGRVLIPAHRVAMVVQA